MIELRTGVPGSGKTLSMVHALARMQERWKTHPDEVRPVFVHGIPDLALIHSPVPLKAYQPNVSQPLQHVPDWDAMPDGSLVIVDECQGFFPPRSSQSAPPAHVSWFNTHRHRGFDVWLTTQHPKLFDGSIRALVGKHMHYRRLFGGRRAVVYEWDACSDSLSGMGNAVKSYFEFPRKAFQYYKSAEIHTKQSFKLPAWFMLVPLSLVACLYAFPRMYTTLHDGMHGKVGESKPVVVLPASAVAAAPVSASAVAAAPALSPEVVAAALRAPRRPVRLGACVASSASCKCYTPGGALVFISDRECRFNAENTTDRYGVDDEPQRWDARPSSPVYVPPPVASAVPDVTALASVR